MFDWLQIFIAPYFHLFNPDNWLMAVFTGLALLQLRGSVELTRTAYQQWPVIYQNPLTKAKKQWAQEASFYLMVPIGVFIHELGHALAVLFVGGQVLEFGFFFFWGYVAPTPLAPVPYWIVATAGTAGSLLFALTVWLLGRGSTHRPVRYFTKRTVSFQLYFSLIYYPIFTAVLPIGDWRIMYNFSLTPLLSGGLAVVHVALLAGHWWATRQGWYEEKTFPSAEAENIFYRLQEAAASQPQDLQLQREWLAALYQAGDLITAQKHVQQLLEKHPTWADGWLMLAVVLMRHQQQPTSQIAGYAQKSLELGLSDMWQKVLAYRLLGDYATGREQFDQAQQAYEQALSLLQQFQPTATYLVRWKEELVIMYISRGHLYRRLKQYDQARADLNQAQTFAQQLNAPALHQRLQQELEVLQHHSQK